MYNAENMGRFLGPDATDADAEKFASFLEANGWVLFENSEGQFEAYKGYEKMSEGEWQNALRACFS